MTILWPIKTLRARDVSFDIAPRSLAGPPSVSGFTQVVSSDAGIWKATLGGIIIRSREHVLTWRAIDTLLEGRLNPILVPFCRAYQPVPDGAVEAGLYDDVPHSDESYHSDDTGYVSAVIDVVAVEAAAARSVSMAITITRAGDIQPGQHFSVGERAYRIRSYDESTGTITFRPPLREAVTAGAALEFDNPVCRMRLATDNEMNLELRGRRISDPTVNFIEDL